MKTILLATTVAVIGLPVLAEGVEPRVHEMCIEAKDYAGCVRAMTTDISQPQTVRQINSQGADIAEGNQCPSGFAYVGGGNCMEVKCTYHRGMASRSIGHDQRVAGKPGWGCKNNFWYGAGTMSLEGNARATINPNCPAGEPKIGYNSTCTLSSLTTGGRSSTPNVPEDFGSEKPWD